MSQENKPEEKTASPETAPPAAPANPETAVGAAAVAAAPVAKKPAVKRSSKLDETKARNKKALAEALVKVQAVKIPPPPVALPETTKTAKPAKPAKPVKAKKVKLVRHSFSMPETEYAQIALLKKRIADFGGKARRSELVRAGIAALAALDNVQLTAMMARIERIKTGRPKK